MTKQRFLTPSAVERLERGNEYVDAKLKARLLDGRTRKAKAIKDAEEWIKTIKARKAAK